METCDLGFTLVVVQVREKPAGGHRGAEGEIEAEFTPDLRDIEFRTGGGEDEKVAAFAE